MKTTRRNYDLSTILKPYENQWVALSFDHKEVLGAGNTLGEAREQAKEKHKPSIFLKLPPYDVSYVPAGL